MINKNVKRIVKQKGFTIVELLIVIVVIGILAAITIVSFNGVQDKAKSASLQADLSKAIKKLEIYKTQVADEKYPATLAAAEVAASSTNTYTYSYAAIDNSYCLATTNGSTSWYATSDSPTPKSGSCGSYDTLGWWKLNGNANDSSSTGLNAAVTAATLTTGQNTQSNQAYSFNGFSSYIVTSSLPTIGAASATLSAWIYNPMASNQGTFVKAGTTDGYGIGIGSGNFETPGSNLILIFENVRWIQTSATIPIGWHHIAMVINANGVPSAYLDGSYINSYPGAGPLAPTTYLTIGATGNSGGGRTFNGSVDDVRVYKRALSGGEIKGIYYANAQ